MCVNSYMCITCFISVPVCICIHGPGTLHPNPKFQPGSVINPRLNLGEPCVGQFKATRLQGYAVM